MQRAAGSGGDTEADTHAPRRSNLPPHGPLEEGSGPGYQAYTTAFDEIVPAEALALRAELDAFYHQLERKLPALKAAASRLAARLQHLLLARQARTWTYDQEEGLLDTRRLARVVATPWEGGFYKQAHDSPTRDTVVTLLLDNSGSMRGRPITIAALSADMLALTLERCGVRTGILGFTTREWKGGQAHKHWVQDGRPPGAGPPQRSAAHHFINPPTPPGAPRRRNLGLMLKDGILKENIDGEAVLWACGRLAQRRSGGGF